jgi:hypothetical protein
LGHINEGSIPFTRSNLDFTPQSSHKKRMKIVENKGFLPTPNAMGWSLAVKTPADFQNTNKINDFEHVSYGMVLISLNEIKCFVSFLQFQNG